MSGGLRAAKRASMPSGYGSMLISLTLMLGCDRSNAASVARIDASSTGDELQCANVMVVAFWALACPDLAEVAPAAIPATRTTSTSTDTNETRIPLKASPFELRIPLIRL